MTQLTTTLIHHPYVPPAGFDAPQPGIFKASTVFFPSVAAMRSREWKDKSAYTYGLHGTPTTYALEERLCALEGGLQLRSDRCAGPALRARCAADGCHA